MQYTNLPTRYITCVLWRPKRYKNSDSDKYQTYINNDIIVNCVWGTWDTWATCSKTCGGGVQVRTRKVDTHEENGGTACTGLSTEQQNCETGTCPAGIYYHY